MSKQKNDTNTEVIRVEATPIRRTSQKDELPDKTKTKIEELRIQGNIEGIKIYGKVVGTVADIAKDIVKTKNGLKMFEKRKELIDKEVEKIESETKKIQTRSEETKDKLQVLDVYMSIVREDIPNLLNDLEGFTPEIKVQIIKELLAKFPEVKIEI